MIPSAYIHVPFCSSYCSYCAFAKTTRVSLIDRWLDALETEISTVLGPVLERNPGFSLTTLYIGGGTPSVLSESQTKRLLDLFSPYACRAEEWTIEANPESVTREKICLWKQAGINRVSIGIQTFNRQRLASLGRHHQPEQAKEAIEMLKEEGIERICADLMYGFPGESLEELERDLDEFIDLDIGHLSIYSLILEEGTPLARRISSSDLDEDLSAQMFETIEKKLALTGFDHYEISSFARNAEYGTHNLLIWQDGLYYGFGYGACGRDENGLYDHPPSLNEWMKDPSVILRADDETPEFDALMTGLRTKWGIDIALWQQKYHLDLVKEYQPVLKKWSDVLMIENGRLKVSEQGMEILDSILVDFLAVRD